MKTIQVKEKPDFTGEPIYIGIDVHKKQWNVSIMSSFMEHKTFTQPPDANVLSNYLKVHFPNASYFSTYEAGFCGFWIHEALKKEGIENTVVNPCDVPTTNKEKKQKRDGVDSRKLCRSLRERALTGIYVPTQEQLEDRGMMRLRKKLVSDIGRCKNRIKGMLNFYGIKLPVEYDSDYWSKAFIAWLVGLELTQATGTLSLRILVEELKAIQTLKKQVESHLIQLARQKYATQVELLRSIPGIGSIAALTFITELGDMKRFKRLDELCSYVGLVPNVHSSGDTEHVGHLTMRRNPYVRPILIQCAWVAASKDPVLMKAHQDWCKKMTANKAIIRVARKLLNRIRFVSMNEKKYELMNV